MDKRKAMEQYEGLFRIDDIDAKVSLIQALIPLGLKEVQKELQKEIELFAGKRYEHGKRCTRWGKQYGSVYLQDQKVPLKVQRVRDKENNSEVSLSTYQRLQQPYKSDDRVFKMLLNGLSMHRYEESAALVPEVFGLSKSQLSERFKKVSVQYLRQLQSRSLAGYDFVAIFLDGKRFAEEGIVVALGITITGEKVMLGLEQMHSENSRSAEQFFNKLIERGLCYEKGLLFVVDGSKGLIKAIKGMFRNTALIQRCWWHKQENVVSYLSRSQQAYWRRRLHDAHSKPDYDKANEALIQCAGELERINPSAANSLREGIADVLSIHKLGLYRELKRSFCTTNCIESILAQVEQYTHRVDYWKNALQRQRWVAAGLLELEPRLRKVSGYKDLPLLRTKIQELLNIKSEQELVEV